MKDRKMVHQKSSHHEKSRKKELAKKILKNATILICQLFFPPAAALFLTQDQQDKGLDGRTAQEDINDKVNHDLEESTLNEPQGELVHEKKEEQIQGEVHEKTKQRQPHGQVSIEYQVHQMVPAQSEEEIIKLEVQRELEKMTKRRKAEQEEQRKKKERRMKLEKDIKDKEARVKELKSEKETLKKDYKKKLPDYTEELKKLKKLRKIPEAEDTYTYNLIIKDLVNYVVAKELETLLTVPVVVERKDIKIVTSSDRDQYGAYGLLVSAYKIQHPSLTIDEDIIKKVCSGGGKDEKEKKEEKKEEKELFVLLEGKMKENVAANVKTSIKLTQEMLFLIPPLVVGSNEMVHIYHEDLCDTNRKTWDEKKEGDQLLWYRPLLTYGNQLHIAVKGLVGNCTEPIPEEEKEEEVQTDTNERVLVSPEITFHDDPEETSDTNEEFQDDKETMI